MRSEFRLGAPGRWTPLTVGRSGPQAGIGGRPFRHRKGWVRQSALRFLAALPHARPVAVADDDRGLFGIGERSLGSAVSQGRAPYAAWYRGVSHQRVSTATPCPTRHASPVRRDHKRTATAPLAQWRPTRPRTDRARPRSISSPDPTCSRFIQDEMPARLVGMGISARSVTGGG